MACCGKTRANLNVSRAGQMPAEVSSTGSSPVLRQPGDGSNKIKLRYLGQTVIVVRGPATGLQYAFSASNPVHAVNLHDAAVFLRTKFFKQV